MVYRCKIWTTYVFCFMIQSPNSSHFLLLGENNPYSYDRIWSQNDVWFNAKLVLRLELISLQSGSKSSRLNKSLNFGKLAHQNKLSKMDLLSSYPLREFEAHS